MKNSYLTMIIFTIFIIGFCTNTRAQKQGRVERLYQHITWSEGDKYDRLRARMDTKSMDAYKNEILLADALRQLLLLSLIHIFPDTTLFLELQPAKLIVEAAAPTPNRFKNSRRFISSFLSFFSMYS